LPVIQFTVKKDKKQERIVGSSFEDLMERRIKCCDHLYLSNQILPKEVKERVFWISKSKMLQSLHTSLGKL